jgi:hypothetical protein
VTIALPSDPDNAWTRARGRATRREWFRVSPDQAFAEILAQAKARVIAVRAVPVDLTLDLFSWAGKIKLRSPDLIGRF